VGAARGGWGEAEAHFLQAAKTFRRHGMMWQEAYTFQSWGHALQGGPDRSAAIKKLDTAIEMLRSRDVTAEADARPHANAHPPAPSTLSERRSDPTTSPDESPPPALAPPMVDADVFPREGDYWTSAFGRGGSRPPRTKG